VYIFAYGSLMAKHDIERTLGCVLPDHAVIPATLNGYKRDWSAVRQNTSSSWKWLIDRQTGLLPRFVAYLNIVVDHNSAVEGMVFPIDEEGMAKLDRREVGYDRVEVDVFDTSGKRMDGTVFTYVDQCQEHITDEIYISYHYLNFIRSKCLKLEHVRKAYLDQTSLPDARLADLDVVYFNQGFSKLYKLKLDEYPGMQQVASMCADGCWESHLTGRATGVNQATWERRFAMACQSDSPEQMRILQHDPCFLVRTIVDYHSRRVKDIKSVLSRQILYSQEHGLMLKNTAEGEGTC